MTEGFFGQLSASPVIPTKGQYWTLSGTNTLTQGAMLTNQLLFNNVFDSRKKYEELKDIKRRFDPSYVFTANGMGVDATSAPSEQCPKITEK